MIVTQGMHRSDYGDVVDTLRRILEQLRNFDTGLSILLEFERAPQKGAGEREERLDVETLGWCFAMPLAKLRLRVEGIDVACAAVHEQRDHRLRLGREMERLGGQ